MRRSVRAAEGAGLENQWAEMSRGFESHGLRHHFSAIVKTVNDFPAWFYTQLLFECNRLHFLSLEFII